MDMALVAGISAMMQAQVQGQAQASVMKEALQTQQVAMAKLLQAMPSVDVNPAIGNNLNVVA